MADKTLLIDQTVIASKAWVDEQIAGVDATNAAQDTAINGKVAKAGDTMTGTLRVPAGSTVAPGLAVGENITGLKLNSAGVLGFSAGSVDSFRINQYGMGLGLDAISGAPIILQKTGLNIARIYSDVAAGWQARQFNNNAGGAAYAAVKGRGTFASPSLPLSGDSVVSLQGYIYTGGVPPAETVRSAGHIALGLSEPTPSDTALGSRWAFITNPLGSTSSAETMSIEHSVGLSMYGANPVIDVNRHHRLRSYTMAQAALLSASPAGQEIYISDEIGGGTEAFSDGTNWRRVHDRGISGVAAGGAVYTAGADGLAPMTGAADGDATKFLSANRTWVVPSGAGAGVTNAYSVIKYGAGGADTISASGADTFHVTSTGSTINRSGASGSPDTLNLDVNTGTGTGAIMPKSGGHFSGEVSWYDADYAPGSGHFGPRWFSGAGYGTWIDFDAGDDFFFERATNKFYFDIAGIAALIVGPAEIVANNPITAPAVTAKDSAPAARLVPLAVANTAGPAAGADVTIDLDPTAQGIGVRSAQIGAVNPTSTSVRLEFRTSVGDVPQPRVIIGTLGGLYGATTTGGDKGALTANFTTIYENNVSLSAKYQPLDADLTTLASSSAFFLDMSNEVDAPAMRTKLGLGTAAVKNTGASGDAVPLLNAANTWSLAQSQSVAPTLPAHLVTKAYADGLIPDPGYKTLLGPDFGVLNDGTPDDADRIEEAIRTTLLNGGSLLVDPGGIRLAHGIHLDIDSGVDLTGTVWGFGPGTSYFIVEFTSGDIFSVTKDGTGKRQVNLYGFGFDIVTNLHADGLVFNKDPPPSGAPDHHELVINDVTVLLSTSDSPFWKPDTAYPDPVHGTGLARRGSIVRTSSHEYWQAKDGGAPAMASLPDVTTPAWTTYWNSVDKPPVGWEKNTQYLIGDVKTHGGAQYYCKSNHISNNNIDDEIAWNTDWEATTAWTEGSKWAYMYLTADLICNGFQRPIVSGLNGTGPPCGFNGNNGTHFSYHDNAFMKPVNYVFWNCYGPNMYNSASNGAKDGIFYGHDPDNTVEGGHFDKCTNPDVMRGFRCLSKDNQPGLNYNGGHINARDDCILFEPMEGMVVSACVTAADADGTGGLAAGAKTTRFTVLSGHGYVAGDKIYLDNGPAGSGDWAGIGPKTYTVDRIASGVHVFVGALDVSNTTNFPVGGYTTNSGKVWKMGYRKYLVPPNYSAHGSGGKKNVSIEGVDALMLGVKDRGAPGSGYGVEYPSHVHFIDQSGYLIQIRNNTFGGTSNMGTARPDPLPDDWFGDHTRCIWFDKDYDPPNLADPNDAPLDGWQITGNNFQGDAAYRVWAPNANPKAVVIGDNFYRPQCEKFLVGNDTFHSEGEYNEFKLGERETAVIGVPGTSAETPFHAFDVMLGAEGGGCRVIWTGNFTNNANAKKLRPKISGTKALDATPLTNQLLEYVLPISTVGSWSVELLVFKRGTDVQAYVVNVQATGAATVSKVGEFSVDADKLDDAKSIQLLVTGEGNPGNTNQVTNRFAICKPY